MVIPQARTTAPRTTSRVRSFLRLLTCSTLAVALAACGAGGEAAGDVQNQQAVQIGQNLNGQPANNAITCADGVPAQTPAFLGFIAPEAFMPFQGKGSCTLITFFDGAQVGAPGTVTAANIKIGPVTGPMRFVRARVLFDRRLAGNEVTCCSVEQVGPTFTPAPNGITTVPLNFVMTFERIPAQNELGRVVAQDMVALEILAPNVPIPGTWMNPPFGGNMQQANYIYWPAFTTNPSNAGQNRRSNASFSGFMPSYNLNFVPARVSGRIVEP
jgi:hypothetical protein